MLYRLLYNLLIHLFSPLLLALLYWPKKANPALAGAGRSTWAWWRQSTANGRCGCMR
ncbi:hypothetical protein MBH78_08095 [Oceanimonas sp. NS1]|nr:hypothetical protein [Oceanimonas sp. NS1]